MMEWYFICEFASDVGVDTFGHKMLTGSGKYLENLIKEKLGVKVRSVELNVSQRCSSSCLSGTDLEEAVCAGSYGVDCAMDGKTGVMITFERQAGDRPGRREGNPERQKRPGTVDVIKRGGDDKKFRGIGKVRNA